MLTLNAALEDVGLSPGNFPNLVEAFDLSQRTVAEARELLTTALRADDPCVDVVGFGSLARYELTPASDLDLLLVSYGFDATPGASRRALEATGRLHSELSTGTFSPPGATEMFGTLVSAMELVEVIGLEGDTNRSHTRRILLLEESVSLFNEDRHRHLISSVMSRYLDAKPIGETVIPRFLLNDLARYWRTLTVDYQAKSEKYAPRSVRHLKLMISRKFTYASSVLPLFALAVELDDRAISPDDLHAGLVEYFMMPPVLRILAATRSVQARGIDITRQVGDVLFVVDAFNAHLGDSAWRDALQRESATTSHPLYEADKALARKLQLAVEEIFFADRLVELSRHYLVF